MALNSMISRNRTFTYKSILKCNIFYIKGKIVGTLGVHFTHLLLFPCAHTFGSQKYFSIINFDQRCVESRHLNVYYAEAMYFAEKFTRPTFHLSSQMSQKCPIFYITVTVCVSCIFFLPKTNEFQLLIVHLTQLLDLSMHYLSV